MCEKKTCKKFRDFVQVAKQPEKKTNFTLQENLIKAKTLQTHTKSTDLIPFVSGIPNENCIQNIVLCLEQVQGKRLFVPSIFPRRFVYIQQQMSN